MFGGSFRNDGTVTALTSTSVALNVLPTGTLSGTGLVNGDVFLQGTMAPGDSPGTFTVNGNYTQTATATFLEEIAGTGAGQFDMLVVDGNLTLDGTLDVEFLNGFTGAVGDSFTLISFTGSRTGEFRFGDFPALGPASTGTSRTTTRGTTCSSASAEALGTTRRLQCRSLRQPCSS